MKLALTVRNGSLAGKNWELTAAFLTVGRGSTCDVMFDPIHDRVVSTNHAYIENKFDGFYLVDHQSTNGTFVNGEKIEKALLKNRDVIQFGKNGPEAIVFIGEDVKLNPPNFSPQSAAGKQQFSPPQQTMQMSAPPVNLRNSAANFGIGNPQIKPATSAPSKKHVGVAIAIWILVFISLPLVAVLIVGNLGFAASLIAAVVAFVPAAFYILPLMFLDRYDPEPPWALAMAFAWGALVSVLFSALVNDFVAYGVSASFGMEAGEKVSGIISAPIFEEASKGLGVLLFAVFLRREFDDILDGIVYAGTVALGFATVENVLYYGRGLISGGSDTLIFLFFLRGILSPFAHVTFTAMTGIGCGIARESHNLVVRLFMPVLGYICAVVLHMLWNGMAFLGGVGGFLIGYILLEIPFFLMFVSFAIYIMRRQNKILKEMLAIDVARGLISPQQLEIATSAFKSLTWLLGSAFTQKYRARRRFLRAVGKLGLSYWHIQRATAAKGDTASFQQNPILREEVLKWRDLV